MQVRGIQVTSRNDDAPGFEEYREDRLRINGSSRVRVSTLVRRPIALQIIGVIMEDGMRTQRQGPDHGRVQRSVFMRL